VNVRLGTAKNGGLLFTAQKFGQKMEKSEGKKVSIKSKDNEGDQIACGTSVQAKFYRGMGKG